MHYQTHLDWTKSLIERRLSNIKAGSRNESASIDDYQQAIFDCSSSTAELGSAEALAAHARMNSNPLLEEMAELHAGMMVKSIIDRLSIPILTLGEGSGEPIPAALKLFIQECHQPKRLAALGQRIIEAQGDLGPRGLSEEKSMMADTFQQFADEVVAPLAEQIHREDQIIPDTILEGLKSLGCFGLSVPEQYGGLLPNDKEDTLGMIVVTEELSRVSLGGAGSLITRPEILARAMT